MHDLLRLLFTGRLHDEETCRHEWIINLEDIDTSSQWYTGKTQVLRNLRCRKCGKRKVISINV